MYTAVEGTKMSEDLGICFGTAQLHNKGDCTDASDLWLKLRAIKLQCNGEGNNGMLLIVYLS